MLAAGGSRGEGQAGDWSLVAVTPAGTATPSALAIRAVDGIAVMSVSGTTRGPIKPSCIQSAVSRFTTMVP